MTSWPKWISQLEVCAKECLPVDQGLKGAISPMYWDSDPLALNPKYAYNGFANNPQWAEGVAMLTTKLLALNRNRPVHPGSEFVTKKTGMQKFAHNIFMSFHSNLDFNTYLK